MGVLLAFFYNVVVSWSLWYLWVSVLSLLIPGQRLEWAHCDHSYNSHCCSEPDKGHHQSIIDCNQTTSSVEEYWHRHVLAHFNHDWTSYVMIFRAKSMKDALFQEKDVEIGLKHFASSITNRAK